MTLSEQAADLLKRATPGDWMLGEYNDSLGYDCMTGGVRAGPAVLDGADYGQKRCKPIEPEDLERMLADAALIAAAPSFAAEVVRLTEENERLTKEAADAGEEADQARSDAEEADVWPDWARQMLSLLEKYGYRLEHGDEIDLPQEMAEWLNGYDNDNACRDAVARAEAAERKLADIHEIASNDDRHSYCDDLDRIATLSSEEPSHG
jgi:hypothetical protein